MARPNSKAGGPTSITTTTTLLSKTSIIGPLLSPQSSRAPVTDPFPDREISTADNWFYNYAAARLAAGREALMRRGRETAKAAARELSGRTGN
jgi:hypothetical protein